MAENKSTEGATDTIPTFRFEADLGTELKGVAFEEISGLDAENNSSSSVAEPAGIAKYRNITMKKGVFANSTFWDWQKEISMNISTRRTVVIKLLDEAGNIAMQWQLTNAWPTKITGTNLKPDAKEVAVVTLEMAYEGLVISKG